MSQWLDDHIPGAIGKREKVMLQDPVQGSHDGIAVSRGCQRCDEDFFRPTRWLSPGCLSSQKIAFCKLTEFKAAATSVVTIMCMQKRTELISTQSIG